MVPWNSPTQPGMIEPELQGRTPRRAHYTVGTQASRLFLLLLFVGSVWLVSWMGTRDLDDLMALQEHGTVTTAHVTGKRESHGKSTTYYLDYSFSGAGEEVGGDESVPHSEYDEAAVGDTIAVTYLPSQPQTHRVGAVDDARVSGQRIKWLLGVLATLTLFGGVLWGAEAGYRSRRRLLEEGVPVVGAITDRKAVQGKSTTYYVSYRFPGPGGDRTKRVAVSRAFYEQSVPGQSLTILYDASRLGNSRPYRTITDVALDG